MKSKKQNKSGLNCAYCGKEFKYESERKRHEQSHSPQFECKVCAKKFSFLSAVRRHEKQHERTGSVVCSECNRKFRDDSLLKRHIKYAHKGSFSCSKCESTFSSELALSAHTKTHRLESERRFHCSFPGCGKTFNFTHHLKHHELTHTNTKQHYCNICGKGFIQSHHLKSHKKKHEPAHWFTCEKSGCKKTFSTEYAMKRHLATHKNSDSEEFDITTIEKKPSCDVTESIETDTVVCETCNQVLLRDNYADHLKKCGAKEETMNTESVVKETQKTETAIQKKTIVSISFDDDIGTCKSYLGECIVEADDNGNEQCLCAQITHGTDTYELNSSDNASSNGQFESKLQKTTDRVKDDICEGCECAGSKSWSKAPFIDKQFDNSYDEPNIEYRNDGTIKIKDTFDVDMPTGKDNFDIPYNSCKDVLGKCIVSGNGNMDEGCLCARMAMDDQQMIAQEIDELTPCPK